jgi:hypothetical protein
MLRLFIPAALLFLIAALLYRGEAQRRGADRDLLARKLHLADEENDRLRRLVQEREAERAQQRNGKLRQEIERAVEEIRGLKFKQPVDYEIVTRAEIRGVLSGKLAESATEAEFAAAAWALSRLGLLPEGYALRQSYLDLLSEQLAAYYDQHRHKLIMFAHASLENAQNRVILAHELTHALQDQHFGLARLPLEIKDNDDRALAASALVEGEATLVMTQYQMRSFTLRGLRETVAATFTQNMGQLEKAPRYLRELMIFPYLRGQEFCTALTAGGGYDAISRAYAKLPASTAQIMHPEDYLAAPGEPAVAVAWSDTAFDGEPPAVSNVLGELGTRMQLASLGDDLRAEAAAAGWRGDRYLSFPKHDALVWKTAWRNKPEAAEFAAAQRSALTRRYQLRDPREDGIRYASDAPRAIRVVQLQDSSVLVVDAGTAGVADALVRQFGDPK